MATESLLSYKNPPLDEVVLGITFETLHQLKVPYIGSFWERVRDRFPKCEQVPILGNINEVIEPQLGLPVPRVWLINDEDDHLIQIQKNKFYFNWRKRGSSYPRFRQLYESYLENFNKFENFVNEQNLGEITAKNYELTYFNNILQGEGWESLETIQSLFPDLCWRNDKDRFLPNASNLLWQVVFNLPENYGGLAIKLQTASRNVDKHPLIRLELTANGFNKDDMTVDGMKNWFDVAHDWIFRSFEDVTDKSVQLDKWGKI